LPSTVQLGVLADSRVGGSHSRFCDFSVSKRSRIHGISLAIKWATARPLLFDCDAIIPTILEVRRMFFISLNRKINFPIHSKVAPHDYGTTNHLHLAAIEYTHIHQA